MWSTSRPDDVAALLDRTGAKRLFDRSPASGAETRPSTGTCPVCFVDFTGRPHAVYCSKPCGWKASRQRQREKTYGRRQGRQTPQPEPLPPDTDRPDLYADGWLTGRSDTLRDLRTHLPHDGDPCELCAVLRDVLAVIQGWVTRGECLSAAEGQNITNLPGGYRL